MRRVISVLTVFVFAAAAVAAQQAKPAAPAPGKTVTMVAAGPITTSIKAQFNEVKDYVLRSAQMVSDQEYAFKPQGVAADVRSYGQLLGHIANANYLFCGGAMGAAAQGERGPGGANFEEIKSKVEMGKALAASFAYCDKAYNAVNDHNGGEPVTTLPIGDTTKLGALAFNNAHMFEHYGNIVTYLRAMGKVPPSSQPGR
ncbi:MAG TPA: DinB family protein [Vicinamibacterales bacterium]|nr:DinB family protein [Vicinamibacterales bacterium]